MSSSWKTTSKGDLTPRRSWNNYTKKILLSSSFVVVPMVAFSIAMFTIVFSNIIDLNHCPQFDLCPYLDVPGPANSSDYYIDFSVGRVAFVSSLSSTISFALVAAMMTMYGYVVASQLLYASETFNKQDILPTPHGTSTLSRLLNAEILLIWDMLCLCYQRLLQYDRRSIKRRKIREPQMLRLCRIAFLLSLSASVSVQLADTYLHIVINAVSATQLLPESSTKHHLSRQLAPWYFPGDDISRTHKNKYFWSAALTASTPRPDIANRSSYVDATDQINSYMLNYTDAYGISYAVVRPLSINRDLDWSGTGYGVSTQCAAVPRSSCQFSKADSGTSYFNCTTHSPQGSIIGGLTNLMHKTWTDDWHEFLAETRSLTDSRSTLMTKDGANSSYPTNMTMEESNAIFRNPWHWMAKINVLAEDPDLPDSFSKSPFLLKGAWAGNISTLLMTCNTTVYDTRHTIINGKISSLTTSKSNGSIAGMVSMTSLDSLGFRAMGNNMVVFEVNRNLTTPEAFIETYALSMSKRMSVPLVVHTVPAPATLVQRRVTSVVTKLPKLAFWLLVVANLLFGLLGLILGILAIKVASPEVHQVQIRLSTSGLAAQLFEPQHARREAESDTELFEENVGENRIVDEIRVGVQCTKLGGAEFVAQETLDKVVWVDDQETLTVRQTHMLGNMEID